MHGEFALRGQCHNPVPGLAAVGAQAPRCTAGHLGQGAGLIDGQTSPKAARGRVASSRERSTLMVS